MPSTPPPTRTVNIVPTTPVAPQAQVRRFLLQIYKYRSQWQLLLWKQFPKKRENQQQRMKVQTSTQKAIELKISRKPKTTEDDKGKEEKEKSKEDKEKKDEQVP